MTTITLELDESTVNRVLTDALTSRPLLISILDRLDVQAPLLFNLKELIMTTLEDLQAISAQVGKIGTESSATLAKVAALEAALAAAAANGTVIPQAIVDAVAALKVQVQIVDDLVPDPTPVPAPAPAP